MTKGFVKMKRGGYAARINHRGVRYHLGTFHTPEEAKTAYDAAVKEMGINPKVRGRRPQASVPDMMRLIETNRERLDALDREMDLADRKLDFLNNLVRSLQKRIKALEKAR